MYLSLVDVKREGSGRESGLECDGLNFSGIKVKLGAAENCHSLTCQLLNFNSTISFSFQNVFDLLTFLLRQNRWGFAFSFRSERSD